MATQNPSIIDPSGLMYTSLLAYILGGVALAAGVHFLSRLSSTLQRKDWRPMVRASRVLYRYFMPTEGINLPLNTAGILLCVAVTRIINYYAPFQAGETAEIL